MIRWLRVVTPPGWTVLAAILWIMGVEFLPLGVQWSLGLPFDSVAYSGAVVLPMVFFIVLYALFRVRAFHPVLRTGYANWLMGTPWTSRKPLPLGPIHLVLQDVLLVGAAVGLCWPTAGVKSLAASQAFLEVYLTLLCFTHFVTGQKAWAYVVAAGIGFMGVFFGNPLFIVAAGITYGAGVLGLRASLAQFPWDHAPNHLEFQFFKSVAAGGQYKMMLGWPYDRLRPGFPSHNPLALGETMIVGLLAGWWSFAAAYQLNRYEPGTLEGMIRLSGVVLLYAATARVLLYCNGYMPPLNLWGRIARGRLIIPGYDQVFVAPLLAPATYAFVNTLPLWTGMPGLIAYPLAVTASWWILFGMGPSLNAWRLTGNHRIVKGWMTNPGS